MKTSSLPSGYRYCISRLSMTACSTFSPARNVRSICAPAREVLRGGRTHAPPARDGPPGGRPGWGVLELRAHEGTALARLGVLEVDDREQPLREVQGHPVLDVVGGDGQCRCPSVAPGGQGSGGGRLGGVREGRAPAAGAD